jgi:uncharacterized protein YukE
MPLLLLIALSVVIFASTAGAVYVFLRARVLWRTLKSLGSAVDVTVDRLNDSMERLAANAEAFGSETPKLNAALARLRRSLAKAAVLRASLQDVQDAFGRLTAVYPRK